ncbi:BsuPI-related putative proteinase inhibitor [Corynebacterium otitidis]|uniref:BsuPI-related putative proteinase inhibitor n=1 Tax=Corynebacterium otitidis TaxID=29321 RepID=UPI00069AEDC3|nr:BsuPI-related putative proteinase inhibitor [Corynebacterium otitidis]
MSSPRRPLPKKIYVRRRVAAVVALLVLIAIFVTVAVIVVRNVGDDEPDPAATETSSSTSTSASEDPASPTGEPLPEEDGGRTLSEWEEERSDSAGKDSCETADLTLRARANKATYEETDTPVFQLEVKNPTNADCEVNLADETLRFEVYDMATHERIWSDLDCLEAEATGNETFKAGESRYFQATWGRQTSAPDQCDDREEAESGSYYLHGVIGDNASDPEPFNLA